MSKKILLACSGLFLFTMGCNAAAGLIRADMSGPTAGGTTDFWGVSFVSGSGWIQSVSYDLSYVDPVEGYFDFDGTGNYGLVTYPVLGAMSGLTGGDISYVMSNFQGVLHPRVLTFNFVPGTFSAGDYFRFSADVDWPDSGWELAGAGFTAVLDTGVSLSGFFQQTAVTDVSIVELQTPERVPEPMTVLLMLLGLPLIAGARFGNRPTS